ncbi:MAG: hypothetical protein [Olavius algarvensis Delta 4 endosymbiont]|nr:MAG: hypothetical protein [Olavius algarvensis Delta 4 endosymbiont]
MQILLKRSFTIALILLLASGQAAAFDLKIGQMNIGASPFGNAERYAQDSTGFGAMLSVPLGFSDTKTPSTTLNGQDISHFTQQDAKDSLIVIMIVGVAIAAGALTVSAASN